MVLLTFATFEPSSIGHPIMPRWFDDALMLVRRLVFIVMLLEFVTRNNATEDIALSYQVTDSPSQVLQLHFRDHCVACQVKCAITRLSQCSASHAISAAIAALR
jgi:hypothetical protein